MKIFDRYLDSRPNIKKEYESTYNPSLYKSLIMETADYALFNLNQTIKDIFEDYINQAVSYITKKGK